MSHITYISNKNEESNVQFNAILNCSLKKKTVFPVYNPIFIKKTQKDEYLNFQFPLLIAALY